MSAEVLARIRQAVREKRYQMTDHALEEADADDLTLDAILDVLLNGALDSTYTDDPRGSRYVIRGDVRGKRSRCGLPFSSRWQAADYHHRIWGRLKVK